MTIHTDWARIMYEECPEAFHDQIPRGRFDVGVIDGHLQLMCLNAHFRTWDAFLMAMFVRPIQRLFDAGGCATVVLCFDSYDHVPSYKAMTQLKRMASRKAKDEGENATIKAFGPGDDLPGVIPEDAMAYMMNRNFKLKVAQLACRRVPGLIAAIPRTGEWSLIVDYKCVVEYKHNAPHTPLPIPDFVSLGESDIKFVRYVQRYGNALVHAVDGDYMAIALLYFAAHGLTDTNRIFLFRQLSELSPMKEEEGDAPGQKRKKGKADDDDDCEEEEEEGGKKKKKPRKKNPKCWVDMQLLFVMLAQSMRQSIRGAVPLNPRTMRPFSDGDAVHSIVFLMLCAGTDFSRPMPLLGPKRLWDYLPMVATALLQGAALGSAPTNNNNFPSPHEEEEEEGLFVQLEDGVIGQLYRLVFSRHVSEDLMPVRSVLHAIRQSGKLSVTTKNRLPTPAQVDVTLHNIFWVMGYWLAYNAHVPTPLDGTHGYVRCPTTHQIAFADVAARDAGAPKESAA